MKNRLQFNRMPKLYANREEATAALELHYKDSSFIPLIGEPLVVRYYDANGKKQAILAIGKATGQTAEDKVHREYHIIDTAEINENVAGASFSAETALDLASAATQSVNNYFQILKNMIEAEGIDLDDGSYFDDDDPTKDPSTCGKYKPLENSNYLDDAKNLREADKLLDQAIGNVNEALNDKIDELSANTMAADQELADKIDELSGATISGDNKLDELSANTMAADQELSDRIDDLKIVRITTELPANAREVYELHDSDDRRKGDRIIIYKDSSLIRAYLGHADDYLEDPRSSDVTEGTGDAALCFIYQDYEGLYTLIPINLETFLEENEFGEGLVVNNHVVSVNSAITGERDRAIAAEDYLSAVTNNIIQAAGLTVPGEEGKYPGHSAVTCYYISAATSLDNADVILDNAIHALSGVVAEMGSGSEVEELSAVTQEFSATTNYKFTELSGMVVDNEEVTAAALNDLNRRVIYFETHYSGEYIPITNYVLASGITEEELILDEDDTVNEAFGKLQKQILDNEEAVAAGLNDLNRRVIENTEAISKNTGVKALSGAVMSFSAATDNKFNIQNTNIQNLSGSVVNNRTDINILSGLIGTVSAKTSGVLTIELNGEEQGKYSPSADTVVSLTAITEVTGADVLLTGYELATGTTEEELAIVASDTVNEAFGKVQKQIYDNEAVVAGALNDLNDRINDIETGGSADVTALSASVVTNKTNINNLSSATLVLSADVANCFDNADYDSNAKKIYFKHGNTVIDEIDATDFIKDGMVDNVVIDTPTAGTHSGVECLIITFNSDAGKETIEIPVADIFDPATLNELSASVVSNQNKITTISGDVIALSAAVVGDIANLGELSASVVNNRTDIDYLSGAMIDNELVIAAAFNDLNARIIDLSGDMPDMSNYYTKAEVDAKILSAGTFDPDQYYTKNEINALSASLNTNITQLSSATHTHINNEDIHVTSTQKNYWTNGANSGYSAYTAVTQLSSVTQNHINNGDIHVTTTEKNKWNNAYNSGYSAYTAVTQLSGVVENNFYNKTEINGMVKKEFTATTSVANLTFEKFLTIVTLGTSTNLTITSSPTWDMEVGEVIEAHVIIQNTGSTGIIVTLPSSDSRVKITGDDELLVDPSGFGEVNAMITKTGNNAYVIYLITSF